MRSGRGLELYYSSVEGSTGLVGFEERSWPSPSGMWAASAPRAEIAKAATQQYLHYSLFILHYSFSIAHYSRPVRSGRRTRVTAAVPFLSPCFALPEGRILSVIFTKWNLVESLLRKPRRKNLDVYQTESSAVRSAPKGRCRSVVLTPSCVRPPVICDAVCFHGVSRSLLCSSPV